MGLIMWAVAVAVAALRLAGHVVAVVGLGTNNVVAARTVMAGDHRFQKVL
jgi:hypothetical protein